MFPLTTRLWCMELPPQRILITPILIRATCRGQLWHGAQGSRWVPLLGGLGAATGAIAIGTVEMSISTTIIISIATTTSTAMLAARGKVIGSITRNTGEMRLMGTGKRRINSAVRVLLIALVVELALGPVRVELELGPVLAELELGPVLAELELGQVEAELELGQVEAELGLVQVQAELELVQVVAELELVQVEAVPARGPLPDQLAGVLKTKSVTGARRRDLVPHLAAGDLAAAAAETTREPAAVEAVIAWEVAE
jgi:hypothetical protein